LRENVDNRVVRT